MSDLTYDCRTRESGACGGGDSSAMLLISGHPRARPRELGEPGFRESGRSAEDSPSRPPGCEGSPSRRSADPHRPGFVPELKASLATLTHLPTNSEGASGDWGDEFYVTALNHCAQTMIRR